MSQRHEDSRSEGSELVRPTSSPREKLRWPLTPIDRLALQWLIQGTWVFDTTLNPQAMKQGLARMLGVYPPLC